MSVVVSCLLTSLLYSGCYSSRLTPILGLLTQSGTLPTLGCSVHLATAIDRPPSRERPARSLPRTPLRSPAILRPSSASRYPAACSFFFFSIAHCTWRTFIFRHARGTWSTALCWLLARSSFSVCCLLVAALPLSVCFFAGHTPVVGSLHNLARSVFLVCCRVRATKIRARFLGDAVGLLPALCPVLHTKARAAKKRKSAGRLLKLRALRRECIAQIRGLFPRMRCFSSERGHDIRGGLFREFPRM